jgi:hypothetical protein
MSFSAASKATAGFLTSEEELLELEEAGVDELAGVVELAGVDVVPVLDWDVVLGAEEVGVLDAAGAQAAIIIAARASDVNNSGFFMIFSFPCIVINFQRFSLASLARIHSLIEVTMVTAFRINLRRSGPNRRSRGP